MKTFILILTLIFCTESYAMTRKRSPVREMPAPVVVDTPKPEPSGAPRITLGPIYGATKAELIEFKRAEEIINEVIQSDCATQFFKNTVIKETDGLSNSELLAFIRKQRTAVPVYVYYDKKSGVIGYRNPPSPAIHTNRYYFSDYGPAYKASNALHETSHVWGFGHDFRATKRRPLSVPYRMNRLIEQCAVE